MLLCRNFIAKHIEFFLLYELALPSKFAPLIKMETLNVNKGYINLC